jgi:hypothetical protein
MRMPACQVAPYDLTNTQIWFVRFRHQMVSAVYAMNMWVTFALQARIV